MFSSGSVFVVVWCVWYLRRHCIRHHIPPQRRRMCTSHTIPQTTNVDGLSTPSPNDDPKQSPSGDAWLLPDAYSNSRHGEPFAPQSWPVASDFHSGHPGNSAAGGEVDTKPFSLSPEPPDPFDSPSEIPSSPAAAFLSSLTPSSKPPPEGIPGYTIGATIGYGGFSTIKEAISPSGDVVAIKIVPRSAFASLPAAERVLQRSRLSHEARIWGSLSHENILPLFQSYKTPDATYLVTLYCPVGSLLDILKREGRLDQSDAGRMFRQIVKGLQYLHETVGLVHGDVKLENVLVDESGVCRITDFGLSRRIDGHSSQASSASDEDVEWSDTIAKGQRAGTSALPVHLSLRRNGPHRHRNSVPAPAITTAPPTHPRHTFMPGSLPYAAPELLLPYPQSSDDKDGQAKRQIADPAQDMWALGVLLYALLTGNLPFRDSFEPRLQMKILKGTYNMPTAIGSQAEAVLKGCLERDVNERWTIRQVDNTAWGIGYGDVRVAPALREEQRTQSHELLTTSSPEVARSQSPSVWSIASEPPVNLPSSEARPPPRVRSQSRSPSPSVAPRTPEDEGSSDYFSMNSPGQHAPREEDDVQIVVKGEGAAEWDRRDAAFDEARPVVEEDSTPHDEDLEEKKRLDNTRSRRVVVKGAYSERQRSTSRTRTWSLDELARRHLAI